MCLSAHVDMPPKDVSFAMALMQMMTVMMGNDDVMSDER
jgi:hypothetical protein